MNSRLPILAASALWFATAGMGFAQVAGQQVAGWMAYRNDSKFIVVVQASSVVKNQERRGPPHLMNPRESAADQVFGAGPKTITVYEPKSGRPLGRLTVPFTGKDLFFAIQVEAGPNNTPARATVVPVPDPRGNPGIPGAVPGFHPGAMPANPALPGLNPILIPGTPIVIPNAPKLPGLPK